MTCFLLVVLLTFTSGVALVQRGLLRVERGRLRRLSNRCARLRAAATFAVNHPQPVDVHSALHDALDPRHD